MKLVERDYGFVYGARRQMSTGGYYWRVTQWMLPMFSQIPHDSFPRSGRAWVRSMTIIRLSLPMPIAPTVLYAVEIDYIEEGNGFPPPLQPSVYTLPDGYRIDIFESIATKENDYGLDRLRQRTQNFSGIHAITDQDRALQENMPRMGAKGFAETALAAL